LAPGGAIEPPNQRVEGGAAAVLLPSELIPEVLRCARLPPIAPEVLLGCYLVVPLSSYTLDLSPWYRVTQSRVAGFWVSGYTRFCMYAEVEVHIC
jgi:hypothetical protein